MTELFGRIYCLKRIYDGDWMTNVLNIMKQLYCMFGEPTDSHPNGIRISKESELNTGERMEYLDYDISNFIINTYIVLRLSKLSPDGEYFVYYDPINIVIKSLTSDYKSILSEKSINSIDTIFNHPHFKGCKSVVDIKEKIQSVEDFNTRFKGMK